MKKLILLFTLLTPLFSFGQYEFYYSYHLLEALEYQVKYDENVAFGSSTNQYFKSKKLDKTVRAPFPNIEYDLSANTTIEAKLKSILPGIVKFYNNPIAANVPANEDIEFLYKTYSSNGELNSETALSGFGITQSNVLLSLASVIIDRAKQQLADTYLNNWAEKMDQDLSFCYLNKSISGTNNDGVCANSGSTLLSIKLSNIFPNTYMQLKQGREIIAPEFGKTLVQAMEKDMKELLDNVYQELPKEIKNDYPQIRYSYASYGLFKEMANGSGFPVAYESFVEEASPNTSSTRDLEDELLQFSGDIIKSFLSPKSGDFFELPEHSLIYEDKLWTMYLAMISKKMADQNYTKLVNKAGNLNSKLSKAKPHLKKLYDNGMNIERKISEFSRLSKNEELSKDTKISYITGISQSGLDAINEIIELVNEYSSNTNSPIIDKQIQSVISQTKIGLEFTESVGTGNYASAANSIFNLFNDFYKDQINPELFKYITLVADVTSAESAEEVKEVFDRAILPAGSYHIKRSTKFSASINAYVGASAGYEWNTKQGDNMRLRKGGTTLGATIPIGVGLNFSQGDENNEKCSHTVFISVLDLGALLNYNLKSDDSTFLTSSNPAINFANVLSPGGSYILGIKNHPISLSFGAQYMPKLRDVLDTDNVVINQAGAFQLRFGLLVDVPLFHIALRGKKSNLSNQTRKNR